jgi:hypothetical protein
MTGQREESDFHLDFGKLVGFGVEDFLQKNDIEQVYFDMFMYWHGSIDADDGIKKKKTFWHGLHAIQKFAPLRWSAFKDMELFAYKTIGKDGKEVLKTATELSFYIDLGHGFSYRGFVDAVMLDKMKNELVVLECKTTGNNNVHEATYKHSGQSLGYSIILDAIARKMGRQLGSSYRVFYPIYKSSVMEWDLFPFNKSHLSRARWLKDILVDKDLITARANDNHFPMYGESCYSFFKECTFFGTCEMSNDVMMKGILPVPEEDPNSFDFQFTLLELIEAQLERHGAAV